MSEPAAPPAHPFSVYGLNEDGSRGTLLGGSYDNISAVQIACAIYTAVQNYTVSTWRKIAVFDETDKIIAFVGAYQSDE